MLPVFYILGLPIFVWLGILLASLVILQMLVGKQIIKLNQPDRLRWKYSSYY